MKMAIALITILLMLTTAFSINNMELIQTMTGEFNGSKFGFNMASIDFNADGYDDLVVSSAGWNPDGVYDQSMLFGKLYFYWGGPNFDNVPDMVISGTHYLHYYGKSLFNAGDINGDGHDDLVISNRDSTGNCTIEIFYSKINPQLTPDVIITFPPSLTGNVYAFPLGDINGDGHADLGFGFAEEALRYGRRVMIMTDITAPPMLFRESNNNMDAPLICGVGDVNHDGIDDFYMHYPINGINSPTDIRLVLYYGSTAFPVMDSLVISENTQGTAYKWGNPVGDVNGDGIDDFAAYFKYLWLGSRNLTATWNMSLYSQYGSSEDINQYTFQHGDLNNDGYEDVVSANNWLYSDSGVLNIWLGSSQMNGNVDLNIFPPDDYLWRNFGWAKAVGDFNGDGFDDIAVSSPWWGDDYFFNTAGKVFIYAGNAQLQDTTVSTEDNIIPVPEVSKWEIDLYPNPVNIKSTLLNIKFVGSGYKYSHDLKAEIFNTKGQKVWSKPIPNTNIKSGLWSFKLNNVIAGNCILVIRDRKMVKTSHLIKLY